MTQFRPMFPPFNGMPDTVELARSPLRLSEYAATLVKPAVVAARQKAQSGHSGKQCVT